MSARPAKRQVAVADLMSAIPGGAMPSLDAVITGIELDSRQVEPGDLFAALPGRVTHGAAHAPQALARGAAAIITDAQGAGLLGDVPVPVIVAPDPRSALGRLAAEVYGHPADGMTLLGVTGTNGKTTVTYLLAAGLRAAGRTTGVIGTIGVRIGDAVLASPRTTPEAVHTHALLGVMRERGVDAVAMEVSSIALCEGRVDGMRFAVAGFTNLSQDHLDYHGTMEAYFAAKAALFTPQRADLGIVGIEDEWGRRLASTASIPVQTWTTIPDQRADWRLAQADGEWIAHGPGGETQPLTIPLPGAYNRANVLCAYAMLRGVGIRPAIAASALAEVTVPGRLEVVATVGGVTGIVDYAHSPDAIERVIDAVRQDLAGRIIVVLGAGGDRDREKRPLMGRAARLADAVIVTDDNPRSEDPAAIRQAVFEGVQGVAARIVPDRRDAIAEAVAQAAPGDTVLVLGKGHELGQEIAGVVHPFDDREALRDALAGAR